MNIAQRRFQDEIKQLASGFDYVPDPTMKIYFAVSRV
jgi:hypothetical protein